MNPDGRVAGAPRSHLLDTTMFFSPTSGGVRRYLLAKHDWLNRNAQVRHTLLVPGAQDSGGAGGIAEFRCPLIPFGAEYRLPYRRQALQQRMVELEPDLIEAGDPYQMSWAVASVAVRLGVPAVAFCHSDLIALVTKRLGGWGARTVGRYLHRLYARFDLVFAPSRMVIEHLQAAGITHAVVQTLGVDAATFNPNRADPALRRSLHLDDGTRLLVFAGRLAPEKNLPELYAMATQLGPDYHLAVIGGVRRRHLTPTITLLPYERNPERLAAWFGAADALVHAGRCETFGLVVLEALACGLPVVAYRAGALPELVDHTVGQLAEPVGPSALVAAVRTLFERDQTMLRVAARARVVDRYSWDRVLRQQLQYYARLLNRPALLRADAAVRQPA